MKIRFRVLSLSLLALAALLFVAACERTDNTPFTAEVDEPGYRRGKELLRQGRNQEALMEFQKVIEKRGLNNAPESHLELGLLYEQHIRDPIAAIYHYRRYRELRPASTQSELVRQRIDAATREFAKTLPADPLNNMDRDLTDVVEKLKRDNDQLRIDLQRTRALLATNTTRAQAPAPLPNDAPITEVNGPAYGPAERSPIARAGADDSNAESAPALPPPTRPATSTPVASTANATPATSAAQTAQPSRATTQPAATAGSRRHVIAKGDTLFSLAQRYYGNRSRWRDIFEANRDVLKSKDDPLRIGQEVKIP